MSALPQTPQNKPPQNKPQLTDVKTLREQARRHIEEGAVTENYAANREKVLELLNEALATELVCVLRYRHDHFMARGFASKTAADEFLEHATQELEHADRIAERIVQLGGRAQVRSQRAHGPQPLRVPHRANAAGGDPGEPRRRAHRHRQLPGDGAVHRRG
jgi:hypothetical protein